jgi:hypothetical protein
VATGCELELPATYSRRSVVEVGGTLSSPLPVAIVVVAVTLRSPDEGRWKVGVGDNLETDADLVRLLVVPKNPPVGVALRRENVIDIMDMAEPGRGLGLGLGGAPSSESVVSAEEYAFGSA